MKWNCRQAWISCAIGIVAGAVLGGAMARCHWHRFGREEGQYNRLLERFSSKLDLTAEQKTQVAAILETKRQKIKALRSEIHPKFEEIRYSTNEEIRKLLAPRQQEKFDKLRSEWESHWKKHHFSNE